jgi:hypothetical protein
LKFNLGVRETSGFGRNGLLMGAGNALKSAHFAFAVTPEGVRRASDQKRPTATLVAQDRRNVRRR